MARLDWWSHGFFRWRRLGTHCYKHADSKGKKSEIHYRFSELDRIFCYACQRCNFFCDSRNSTLEHCAWFADWRSYSCSRSCETGGPSSQEDNDDSSRDHGHHLVCSYGYKICLLKEK